MKPLGLVLVAVLGTLLMADAAQAQLQRPVYRQWRPENYLFNRPTVSPYLNLLRENDSLIGMPNYFTMVRPQLDARQEMLRQEMQIGQMQRQMNTLQSNVQSQQQVFQTGHPTRFNTFLHFYPSLNR